MENFFKAFPKILFYGVVMSNLPAGFFSGVFLFYSKSNFISLTGAWSHKIEKV